MIQESGDQHVGQQSGGDDALADDVHGCRGLHQRLAIRTGHLPRMKRSTVNTSCLWFSRSPT